MFIFPRSLASVLVPILLLLVLVGLLNTWEDDPASPPCAGNIATVECRDVAADRNCWMTLCSCPDRPHHG